MTDAFDAEKFEQTLETLAEPGAFAEAFGDPAKVTEEISNESILISRIYDGDHAAASDSQNELQYEVLWDMSVVPIEGKFTNLLAVAYKLWTAFNGSPSTESITPEDLVKGESISRSRDTYFVSIYRDAGEESYELHFSVSHRGIFVTDEGTDSYLPMLPSEVQDTTRRLFTLNNYVQPNTQHDN
jgi:hypothetical protein